MDSMALALGAEKSGQHRSRIINSEGFLAEVFHPWVRWEGLDLDLRIRPAAAAPAPPAASGNPGYTDLAPSGLRSKNKVLERPG